MRVAEVPHMMTLEGTAILPIGGAVEPALVKQLLNPDTATFVDLSTVGLVNGNKLLAVLSRRSTGTAAQGPPTALPNEPNAWVAIQADERYDTGGTSDGAGAVYSLDLSDVDAYDATDNLTNGGFAIVALEMEDVSAISASLANNAGQGAAAGSPNLASIPAGDTYDAILITCISGDDAEGTAEQDGTSFYTPAPEIPAPDYSAHHAFSSYRTEAFAAVIAPTTAGLTLAINDPATSYAASGWIMRAFGLTL